MDITKIQKEDYLLKYSSPESDVLKSINRKTNLRHIHPRMITGPVQGKFLEFISYMIQPENILEIGTFTGYSAICLAKGLKKGGKLVTIEIDDELADDIKQNITSAGLADFITCLTGNALDIVPGLEKDFDIIFIDGDKRLYPDYYKISINKLKKGGFLIADNVLWDDKVIRDRLPEDKHTEGIHTFNRLVAEDSRVENVILPLRDGLNVVRKFTTLPGAGTPAGLALKLKPG